MNPHQPKPQEELKRESGSPGNSRNFTNGSIGNPLFDCKPDREKS
jgi:hypothetical protein